MIPYNKPCFVGKEIEYIRESINSGKISGDGPFTKRCHEWFKTKLGAESVLLTSSCTHALEMAAILIDIQPGDEVIMPSYTFVSTANAFVLRGANIVFVDIKPDTLNIDEDKIKDAITKKTKAIVVVHYAGISCEMNKVMEIAKESNLYVIEDAAQAMMSQYYDRPVGTMGHLATFSFHETKNYTSGGEGGLLIINDKQFKERAEIIREKGTNRSLFFRGMVDKYTWVDVGSSYLPSDIQAAYLYAQLENADSINHRRLSIWKRYYEAFAKYAGMDQLELPFIPPHCAGNGHIFFLKLKNMNEQQEFIQFLKQVGIMAVFHYIPLHSAPMGLKKSRFAGKDENTTRESQRLVRLPLFFNMTDDEVDYVIQKVEEFLVKRGRLDR